MPLGTPYIKTTIPQSNSGIISSIDGGQALTQYGASVEVVVASQPLTVKVGDSIIQAEKDAPIVTNPALLASLVAANAPLTSMDMGFTYYGASDLTATLFGSFI